MIIVSRKVSEDTSQIVRRRDTRHVIFGVIFPNMWRGLYVIIRATYAFERNEGTCVNDMKHIDRHAIVRTCHGPVLIDF